MRGFLPSSITLGTFLVHSILLSKIPGLASSKKVQLLPPFDLTPICVVPYNCAKERLSATKLLLFGC